MVDESDVQIVEEQFDGIGTGVERELEGDTAGGTEVHKPWDPERIRVSTKNFSLRNVLDMIDSEDLDLAPDFQRNKVWKSKQKSRLVESLLLQIPLPAFYFAEDNDGMLRVVDGLQRLSTIHAFVREESFGLSDLEYLVGEEGKTFGQLTQGLQRRLNNAQIVVHVIDPTTPEEVKYDIFKRINTGGEPLNAMEIRHCMSKSRSRDFLKRCAASQVFNDATGGALENHVRMHDREAALRFCAFSLLGSIRNYDEYGTLERLLDWAARELDDTSKVSDRQLEDLFQAFEKAMTNARAVFGAHAFRKWPEGSERLSPINRALFESWSVSLSRYSKDEVAGVRDKIAAKAREAMSQDGFYISAISTGTSDARRVERRFAVPRRILTEVLDD